MLRSWLQKCHDCHLERILNSWYQDQYSLYSQYFHGKMSLSWPQKGYLDPASRPLRLIVQELAATIPESVAPACCGAGQEVGAGLSAEGPRKIPFSTALNTLKHLGGIPKHPFIYGFVTKNEHKWRIPQEWPYFNHVSIGVYPQGHWWIHWVPKAPRPEQRPQLRQLQVVPLGFGGLVKAMGRGLVGIYGMVPLVFCGVLHRPTGSNRAWLGSR